MFKTIKSHEDMMERPAPCLEISPYALCFSTAIQIRTRDFLALMKGNIDLLGVKQR